MRPAGLSQNRLRPQAVISATTVSLSADGACTVAPATQRELCEEDAGSGGRWGPEPRGLEAAARPLGGRPARTSTRSFTTGGCVRSGMNPAVLRRCSDRWRRRGSCFSDLGRVRSRVSAALRPDPVFPARGAGLRPGLAGMSASPALHAPRGATVTDSFLVNELFVEQLSAHSKVEWEVQRFRRHPTPSGTPPPPFVPPARQLPMQPGTCTSQSPRGYGWHQGRCRCRAFCEF